MRPKPRAPRPDWRSYWRNPLVRYTTYALLGLFGTALVTFFYTYHKFDKMVDQRMRGQIFANVAKIYAQPRQLRPGDLYDSRAVITSLRRAGYAEDTPDDLNIGTFKLVRHGIEIQPGPNSYHSAEGAVLSAEGGKVTRINAVSNGRELGAYELEPELITTLFEGEQRSKRRLVRFEDIPQDMVNAVLAIEDRRFFQHSGVNYFRMAEAGWADLRSGRREQGGSTLTMQVARGFFLTPEKTIRRKLQEMLISSILEQKFTKKQIFELYANQIYMGQRGSFTISGLGEAAQAYFGKDLKNLSVAEAALLAGMIQRPNYFSPYKNPDRALERRNLVLDAMQDTGSITAEQTEHAKAMPLKLAPPNEEASEAPYFVDLVKDTLFAKYNEQQVNEGAYRIYTTLDPDLQRAAAEAMETGLKEVDALVKKQRTRTLALAKGRRETQIKPGPMPQVALVALNPHTGSVLALVGGRDYGSSQLNHAVARRPTGSVFKPFVYAAAMNTAIDGSPVVFTPVTIINDEPTTFTYGDQIYEPRNYEEEYHGPVTARYALALSLNNATVKLAEMVSYDKVAELAKAAGIKSVQPTPAMALGSYDATPLDMAGAYTVFSNSGLRENPYMISTLSDARGNVIENFDSSKKQILDPRIAFVMTDMLQGVLNFGTAAGVRGRGFTAPAAGKTGSSHDAWFAGYTSQLLCVVWVGYDDYSDIHLAGAAAAAPIWAEFMKRAIQFPAYRNPQPFTPPEGVVEAKLDKTTNRVATPTCPDDYYIGFVAGTEPKDTCDGSGGGVTGFFSRLFGLHEKPLVTPPESNRQTATAGTAPTVPAQPQAQKKKKGFWAKLFGRGDNSSSQTGAPPTPSQGEGGVPQ